MPQIKPSHLLLTALLALALGGCGDKNDKAVFTEEHPSDWVTAHKTTAQADVESCTGCHGADLTGGIAGVKCAKCHVGTAPVGTNATGCISCHGNPPNGSAQSNSFPNRKLSHNAHSDLPGVGNNFCYLCHNGFGSSTPDHGTLTAARLSIDSTFRSKQASSAPMFTRGASGVTCSNVSCHGGQTTPIWGSTITSCESCHQLGTAPATPEYNSYFSGISSKGKGDIPPMPNQHQRHLVKNAATCLDCHDNSYLMNKDQHFGKLVSKESVTLTSANTIGGPNTQIGTYNKTEKTCSSVSCHPDILKNAPMPWINP